MNVAVNYRQRNIVFIDSMCNEGVYKNGIKGTCIEVLELFIEYAKENEAKQFYVFLNDYDKEIKHIEFQRKDLTKKLQEQKQYENLSFTTQDLLIFNNTQNTLFYDFSNWKNLLREEKEKIISNHTDNLIVERKNDKSKIIEINYRSSFIENLII